MKYTIYILFLFVFSCTKVQDIKPKYPEEGLWYSEKKGGTGINGLNYHFYLKEYYQLTVEIDNGTTRYYYYGKWKTEKDSIRMGWSFEEKQSIDSAFFYYDAIKAANSENPSPTTGYIVANDPFNLGISKTKSAVRTFVKIFL